MKNQLGIAHLVVAVLISIMAMGLVVAAWYYDKNKENTVSTNSIEITNQKTNINKVVNTNTTSSDPNTWDTYTLDTGLHYCEFNLPDNWYDDNYYTNPLTPYSIGSNSAKSHPNAWISFASYDLDEYSFDDWINIEYDNSRNYRTIEPIMVQGANAYRLSNGDGILALGSVKGPFIDGGILLDNNNRIYQVQVTVLDEDVNGEISVKHERQLIEDITNSVVCLDKNEVITSKWNNYSDAKWGVTFKYPNNWSVRETENWNELRASESEDTTDVKQALILERISDELNGDKKIILVQSETTADSYKKQLNNTEQFVVLDVEDVENQTLGSMNVRQIIASGMETLHTSHFPQPKPETPMIIQTWEGNHEEANDEVYEILNTIKFAN